MWSVGDVFLQKFCEFSACSNDSICTQVGVKFLPENPITSLDFLPLYVGFVGGRTNRINFITSLHRPELSELYAGHFRLTFVKI